MAEKLKLMAIINPISGTDGNKNSMPEMISRIIANDRFDVDTRFTQYAGHATELAQEAISKDCHGVLAVGGDGTVNEVASALRDTPVALGIRKSHCYNQPQPHRSPRLLHRQQPAFLLHLRGRVRCPGKREIRTSRPPRPHNLPAKGLK